jgi:hypothetical protein
MQEVEESIKCGGSTLVIIDERAERRIAMVSYDGIEPLISVLSRQWSKD